MALPLGFTSTSATTQGAATGDVIGGVFNGKPAYVVTMPAESLEIVFKSVRKFHRTIYVNSLQIMLLAHRLVLYYSMAIKRSMLALPVILLNMYKKDKISVCHQQR